MIKEISSVLCLILATIGMASCNIVIIEAGPYAIAMGKDIEINEIGSTDYWTTFGFDPITSRDLIKSNYYDLNIGVFAKGTTASGTSEIIRFSEKPLGTIFIF